MKNDPPNRLRDTLDETSVTFHTFLKWTLAGFIDALFLILWVLTQYLTNQLIDNLELIGIDQVVFVLFQIFFAVSTLAPVALFIYRDIRIMWIQIHKEISRAKSGPTALGD